MDTAYLINTTPKYFYLLPLHIGLIHRYAASLLQRWRIYLATEVPAHPICREIEKMGVHILTLPAEKSGFLASRAAAIEMLPPEIDFVIPIQEDFLLERLPDLEAIQESYSILFSDPKVSSIRWMPCPGPADSDSEYLNNRWRTLSPEKDTYMFTFQATLWRRSEIERWYVTLVKQFQIDYPSTLSEEERRIAEIRANYAENARGQSYFKDWMCVDGKIHLAWKRIHKFANAVYLSPWPYRPTAVVGGRLESWAVELGKREGWPLLTNQ